ncbi:MAG TPA: methyltransferase domain-containing protein [Acidimicrobiales bacterium]|nr:methyltransferase domain-containing protein [Acidimicrobiales bacterium]
MTAPWRCPVCRQPLARLDGGSRWACPAGHSFDVAREGYVNLLVAGQRRSRQPGDSPEMVDARRRFLATGAYDPISAAVAAALAEEEADVVLDVGCGEGRHTRALAAPVVLGVDVSKRAVAVAARAHPGGWYAVASAGDLPLDDGSVDVAVDVFGPLLPAELARVVRPGGRVLVVHPGPGHLEALRALVYADARPHEVKAPLRGAGDLFAEVRHDRVTFPLVAGDVGELRDLFAMTPYRWHAPPDIDARLAAAADGGFQTVADVRLTVYRRAGP